MRIEVYFSDCDRELPFFNQLEDFVMEYIQVVPNMLNVFCRCMEARAMSKKRRKRVAKVFVSRGGIRL